MTNDREHMPAEVDTATADTAELKRDDQQPEAPVYAQERGKDAQDVVVADSMDASDPPSFSPSLNPPAEAIEYDEDGKPVERG